MKKLILVRHAKSSWKHHVVDHERPLNTRGFTDTDLVSKAFKSVGESIDLLISSDAMRAKTTASIFIDNLNIDKNIVQLNHNLYDFSGNDLLKVVKNCTANVNTLMVFGHNHAITWFVNAYGNDTIENVPTCGLSILEFDIDNWQDLKKGTTRMTIFPRDLK
ncbi:SixA phosphatase family protein [Changchengzhania lutea]|uniref:SixA phosphatase family protein n=1 Tax=Changchengzhania lutea TaxID=2049305 RepID=UPI00115CD817|nr:histidine phosphatase family protein [Changchengzhania lutea]